MKKWYFLLILISHQCLAQSIDSVSFPNKYYFIGFLNPSPKEFDIDTADIGYSTLQYHSFSTNGQMIKATHNQSFTDFLDFKLDLTKFSHEGNFIREYLKLYDVNTYLSFSNKEQSYNAKLMLTYQKITMDENGGLSNTTSINMDDPLLNPVKLATAQNVSKNRYHSFSHQYRLSEQISIFNSLSLLKRHKTYTDSSPNSGFYQNVFLDSTQTNDSIKYNYFSSRLGLKYKHFSLSHLLNRRQMSYYISDSTDTDNGLAVSYNPSNTEFNLSLSYYQSGQYCVDIEKVFGKYKQHRLLLLAARQSVPINYNNYISNHFRFQTNYEGQNTQSVSYTFKSTSLVRLKSRLKHYTNYLYFDKFSQLRQYSSSIFYTTNELSLHWVLGNFKGTHSVHHQWTDRSSIFRVPDFSTSASIWFEKTLFDASLLLKMGLKGHYFTPYKANTYNPSLAEFYLQDQTEIGGFPLVDAFVNFQIGSMNANIQCQNLVYQLTSHPHYFIPDYLSQVGLIKFSLIWKLSNA